MRIGHPRFSSDCQATEIVGHDGHGRVSLHEQEQRCVAWSDENAIKNPMTLIKRFN
jgi:hypothetical protein